MTNDDMAMSNKQGARSKDESSFVSKCGET